MIQRKLDKGWIIFLFDSEHAGILILSYLPNVAPNTIQFIHKRNRRKICEGKSCLVPRLMFIKSSVRSRQEMLTNSLSTLVLDNQTLSKPHMYYYHYLSVGWLDIITSTADNYYVQERLIVDKL